MGIKAVIADLDGVVNLGETLIEGVDRTYEKTRKMGIRWIFVTNNGGLLPRDLAARLNLMGLKVTENEVINSASALIRELERTKPGSKVMVIGSEKLKIGLTEAGVELVEDPEGVDIVVSSMDPTFNYDKLANAQKAILSGALFWATNRDPSMPVENGFKPGSGSIVAAIATAAGKEPDRVFGKPWPDLAYMALERLGLGAEEALVIGDRMDTDILFAKNAGIKSALVLTGATKRSDVEDYQYRPDHILESINEIESLPLTES